MRLTPEVSGRLWVIGVAGWMSGDLRQAFVCVDSLCLFRKTATAGGGWSAIQPADCGNLGQGMLEDPQNYRRQDGSGPQACIISQQGHSGRPPWVYSPMATSVDAGPGVSGCSAANPAARGTPDWGWCRPCGPQDGGDSLCCWNRPRVGREDRLLAGRFTSGCGQERECLWVCETAVEAS